ncbi:hypothetical protein NLC35_01780 [Candidatus Aminicenantes bacterium AC-334-K16]|jgi:hypothetical protein|nr:hypothetical protein [Candidatus Aminicenantes bacterium AC-334-K16]
MRKTLPWLIALIITLGAAVYQRVTGPTYPIRGSVEINDCQINFKLLRSHDTTGDYQLSLKPCPSNISGYLLYKRYKTDDPWTKLPLVQKNGQLTASLPAQPAAGKLVYRVILLNQGQEISLTGDEDVVIRFKDPVPSYILIPHVIIMFLAMLFSTRAGIEALRPQSNPRRLALWTLGLLIVGGLVFGPLVQYYAFGAFWTGFPFGYDLTDNKTLIALLAWIAAVIAGRGGRPARKWVLGASFILLLVYLIPHSLLGSELKYE